jgi:hypothetical protein
MQYIKDRIENFDDCFLCRKERCKHVTSWFNVFFDSYNNSMAPKLTEPYVVSHPL